MASTSTWSPATSTGTRCPTYRTRPRLSRFTFWRVGLGLGSILFVLLYLALLPIYPATVQALDKLPTTADGLGWARSGWRIACALTTVSFLLLLVVANTRVHIPGQDVAHRLCFGISFIILACAAQPLLTACGRRLHRAAPDGPGAWLTALRAALCLVLFVSGWVMTYIGTRLALFARADQGERQAVRASMPLSAVPFCASQHMSFVTMNTPIQAGRARRGAKVSKT